MLCCCYDRGLDGACLSLLRVVKTRKKLSQRDTMGRTIMPIEVANLKTDQSLLQSLKSAPSASLKDVREQRISFALGNTDGKSSVTRDQVRQIIERKG